MMAWLCISLACMILYLPGSYTRATPLQQGAPLVRHVRSWQNGWDAFFWYECPEGQTFYRWRSEHHNKMEDRRFQFYCRREGEYYEDDCSYTGWVNKLDGRMNFQCPRGGAVTGVQSFHSNHHEDREFGYKCCRLRRTCVRNCKSTGYINNFDQYIDYSVPANTIIRGFESYHHNGAEDRRWKVHTCQIYRC